MFIQRSLRVIMILGTLIFVAGNGVNGQEKVKTRVTPSSWRVHKPFEVQGEKFTDPFGREGTDVTIAVEAPGNYVVRIELDGSALESLTDDKDSDLLQPQIGAKRRAPVSEQSGRGEGKYLGVTFSGPGRPAKGATKIRIKGKLAVSIAKDEKAFEVTKASLKDGVKTPVGTIKYKPVDARLKKLLLNQTFPPPLEFTGNRPLKSVIATQDDGTVVVYRLSKSFGSRTKADFTSSLVGSKLTVDRCTLNVVYFDKIERITVPIDIEIGLGF